ncbi:cytochrome P450 [Mycena albidolilacea]|uniref:Cytochrome P450 n=1 Tax=Mycena albidolilacea TaxID=1033008 RepID=A0AAD6Z445_9AGAR|nr:cytochrome P450 [Mycena albidolilacea]
MPAIIFHLHGKSAETDGISVDVQTDHSLDELRKTVAAKFSVALPTTVSFHKSGAPETTASDLEVLAAVESILKERTIAILVGGKKVSGLFISINEIHLISRTGPTHPRSHWRHPFIGGYSEIYPDFIGNYQRLLHNYGHIVHVSYLGKSIYLTDDPDCAGIVLSEGEFYSKEIGDNHPLFPLKMSIPNGLFTADSSNLLWSTSHKFMMTAMGAKAMRNYVRTMDSTAKRLVHCFDEGKASTLSLGLRAAGQTIGELAVDVDLKMLDNADSEVVNIFQLISTNLRLAQTLFRKGRVYRALPNPEKREQRFATAEARAVVDKEAERILRDGHSSDMPIDKAAVSTTSLLDYMLHATDEEGRKMDVELVHQNVLTFLGARQVTTSSGLAWLWFCLTTFPVQAHKLYASLIAAGLRKDKEISAEELGKLEYLDWFIKETQRLYNSAFQPTRQAQKGGLLVPKGSQVTVAFHSLMINPECWKDPLTFDPERWGTEAVRRRHKYAYLLFAAGGRSCIGFNFALQEIKLVISRVVLNFQIENTTEGPVIYDPDFLLYRPLNLRIRLHKQLDPEEVIAEGTAPKVEEKVQAPQPAVGAKPLPRL